EKHELGTEVKAVTYQGLEINQAEDGWRCRFVVDV
ncbi:archease, partial [Candidatus Bipolaricaulota bacterium]|nr:archease [Candidatus Bipolaricaulota bacterium]